MFNIFFTFTVNEENHRVLSRTYCGSTAYAAPEILQGIPYNAMMCDVWSLGCILFIMLTGTMPFDDSNVQKMIKSQLKRQFTYPLAVNIAKTVKVSLKNYVSVPTNEFNSFQNHIRYLKSLRTAISHATRIVTQ